jgi:hypothetical protein
MSVYKWPVDITRHSSLRTGAYYDAQFRDPLLRGMIGTGFSEGEAVKDLKQVRREFIHFYEKDFPYSQHIWRSLTTNGRSK